MSKTITVSSGLMLLLWQAAAGLLAFTGQVDGLLAQWPDPSWYALLAATLLAPPRWLIGVVVVVAALLVGWGLFGNHRKRNTLMREQLPPLP